MWQTLLVRPFIRHTNAYYNTANQLLGPTTTRAEALSAIRHALLSGSMPLNIYQPLVTTGYEWVNAVHDSDYPVFLQLDGTPRAATWTPIAVRRVRADKRQTMLPSDFPWLGSHVLILRRAAVDALRDMLDANGEVLALSTTDGVDLSVYNSRVIDALDEANASLMKFPGTDRIMWLKKVAFFDSAIEGADIFRLTHHGSSTYVSERFVERVTSAGLRGLDFTKVWPA